MIVLTRLNGVAFALNPDLIERAEAHPDTVVTLVDGTKYVVSESLDDILDLVIGFRGSVIARAGVIQDQMAEHAAVTAPEDRRPRLVPLPNRES